MYNGQLFQDVYVDKLLNKDSGTFLDLGAGMGGLNVPNPGFYSNTYYFENARDWSGLAIDFDQDWYDRVKGDRYSAVCEDLMERDINEVLEENKMPDHMDYLSFDVDAAQRKVFDELNWNKYHFDVITFEHNMFKALEDAPTDQVHTPEQKAQVLKDYLEVSEILQSFGYIPHWQDVELDGFGPVETWWVSQDVFNKTEIPQLRRVNCKKVLEI